MTIPRKSLTAMTNMTGTLTNIGRVPSTKRSWRIRSTGPMVSPKESNHGSCDGMDKTHDDSTQLLIA